MTQEIKHSDLPWKYEKVGYSYKILDAEGKEIHFGTLNGFSESDAAFITLACNSHYALLEVSKELVRLYRNIHLTRDDLLYPVLEKAKAAISEATRDDK
jgi:hypothetical protein